MPVDLLPVLAVDLLVQQATACGLPEVFHVSPRSRSIAHVLVDLRRAGGAIMPAIDRKCFDCKQTTSHGLVLRVYACLTGHAQRLNMLKERPRKWFFREEVDFLASLAFVVNCGHTIDLQQVQAKRFSFLNQYRLSRQDPDRMLQCDTKKSSEELPLVRQFC